MTTLESLEFILTNMKIGVSYALTKYEMQERVLTLSGRFPKVNEFDRALDVVRRPDNKYGLVSGSTGFYRSVNGLRFKRIKSRQIQKNVELIKAI